MKATIIFVSLLLLTSCIQIELKLRKNLFREKSIERDFFENEFYMHKSLQDFMESNTNKKGFFTKNIENIKKYYRNYKIKLSKYLSSGPLYLSTDYIANIQLGTPAQNLNVAIDMSSPDFIAGSAYCGCAICKKKLSNPFFSYNSLSLKSQDQIIKDIYGPKELGVVAIQSTDWLKIDGINPIEVKFFMVQSEAIEILGENFSGLLGLGFPSSSDFESRQTPNFLNILKAKGKIEEEVFSLILSDEEDESKLIIGGVSDRYFKQDTLRYHNLIGSEFFKIRIRGFKINNFIYKSEGNAILDAETKYIRTNFGISKMINNHVGIHECKNIPYDSLFDLFVLIDDEEYKLTPKQYINRVSDDKCGANIQYLKKDKKNNHKTQLNVLGNVFLHNYYLIFDIPKQSIGLAEKINY